MHQLAAGRRGGRWLLAVVVVLVVLVPAVFQGYQLLAPELVLIYVAAASGLNVSIGYSGEIFFAQATTIGVAAYAAARISLGAGWPAIATLPVAIGVAVVWQVVVSLPGLRIRGLYFAVATFLALLVFVDITLLVPGLTGGSIGLIGVPPLVAGTGRFASTLTFEVSAAVAAGSVLLVRNLVSSSWGLRLRALRDAPAALTTVGTSISWTKIAVYVLSAVPAAVCGWLLAYVNLSVTASMFGISLSLVLFAGVQLVRPGSLWGPVVGTVVLEGYSQWVGPFSQENVLGLGLLLAVFVILFPDQRRWQVWKDHAVQVVRSHRAASFQAGAAGQGAGPAAAGGLDPAGAAGAGSLAGRRLLAPPPVDLPAGNGRPDPGRVPGGGAEAGAAEAYVSVQEIRRAFGGNVAVKSVTFRASGGRIAGLIGDNGSGKTTILNVISGQLAADDGSVTINGRRSTGLGPHRVARLGFCRTFQTPQVIEELTVCQNVELGLLRTMGSSPWVAVLLPWRAARTNRRRRERALEVCRFVGLDRGMADRKVAELSLGLRRVVEVGRAVATGASVVCLDEPAAGLNAAEIAELGRVLRDVRALGCAVVLVEHNVHFVLDLCDEVVFVRRGEVVGVYRDLAGGDLPGPLREYIGDLVEKDAVAP